MSAYTTAILALSPYSYWRLNDASGASCVDSSGNSRTGTLNQGGTIAYGPSYSNTGPVIGDATSKAMGIASQTLGFSATNNAIAYYASIASTVSWFNIATLPSSGNVSAVLYLLLQPSDYTVGVQINSSGHPVISWTDTVGTQHSSTLTGITISTATWYMLTATIDGSNNLNVYLNATNIFSQSSVIGTTTAGIIQFGNIAFPAYSGFNTDTEMPVGALFSECATFTSVITATNVNTVYAAAGYSTPTTGAGASAQSAQTVSASGHVTISGTVGAVQSAQTASGTGKETMAGTGAGVQSAQTVSASGTIANPVTATGASVQSAQTVAATGTETMHGTGSAVQGAQTVTAAGSVGAPPVTGTAAGVQAAQTSNGSAHETISGTAASAQSTQTVTASGSSGGSPVTGTAAGVQSAQDAAASGTVAIAVLGVGASVQAAQTVDAYQEAPELVNLLLPITTPVNLRLPMI